MHEVISQQAQILIVDDHPIVRQGMTMLINGEPDLRVCGAAGDIAQALEMQRWCASDLAIVDMSLAGESGLELVKRLRSEFPDLFILMMSMHDEAIYAEQALQVGAHGYLMKQVATDTMLKAIRQVLSGELYVSEQMNTRMLQRMRQGGQVESHAVNNLTPSEFEVLHLIGMGLATSEISLKLNRSVKTIESHRANMRKKLKLKSGLELTHYAISLLAS